MKAGWGRLRWNVASIGPFTVIFSRLVNQACLGLLRILPDSRPETASQVHFTSAEVKGLPSCHFTPLRRVKVSSVLRSFQRQPVASSGTIVSRLFCDWC